jgi:hypothetical protein
MNGGFELIREVNAEQIQRKLSGKYSHLLPVYEKLRDEAFKIGEDVRFILKTIYIVIMTNEERLGVIFWKELDYLELALPVNYEHERFFPAEHLNYQGMDKEIRLSKVEDVDKFIVDVLSNIYKNINKN